MSEYSLREVVEKAKERRAEALKMRRSGMSIREIGDAWNISYQRASAILHRAERDAKGQPE